MKLGKKQQGIKSCGLEHEIWKNGVKGREAKNDEWAIDFKFAASG